MRKILLGVLVALVLVVVASAGARRTVVYSISVDQAAPAFGDQITVSYAPDPVDGNIVVECFQGGEVVSSETHGANVAAWSYHTPFTLGGTYLWSSGPADCLARLTVVTHGHKVETVASVAFAVSG